jgi:hypothetical protein
MFIGMESTKKATDLNYWKDKIPDEVGNAVESNDTDSPRPFNNPSLFAENTPNSLQVLALEKIIEDADEFHVRHGGRAIKDYLTENGKKKYFDLADEGDGLGELFKHSPNNLSDDAYVWQPVIEDRIDNYGGPTDEISFAWEAHPREDDIQILLGSKEEFEALKNGNATINQIEGVNSLADLLMKSINNGYTSEAEDIFSDLFNLGVRTNVGTNPPVSAYTIKIGQNS